MTARMLVVVAMLGGCGVQPQPGETANEEALGGLGGGGLGFNCYTACTYNWQCPTGEKCANSWCRVDTNYTWCVDNTTAANALGFRQDCGAYGCNSGTGQCNRHCDDSLGCAPGYSCDTSSRNCQWLYADTWNNGSLGNIWQTAPSREVGARCVIKSCSTSSQCESYEYCLSGQCMAKPKRQCYGSLQYDAVTGFHVCGAYLCDQIGDVCLSDCTAASECTVGATGSYCDRDARVCHSN